MYYSYQGTDDDGMACLSRHYNGSVTWRSHPIYAVLSFWRIAAFVSYVCTMLYLNNIMPLFTETYIREKKTSALSTVKNVQSDREKKLNASSIVLVKAIFSIYLAPLTEQKEDNMMLN